jgi:hypothetical protein
VANVFVSYARRDRDRVLALVSALEHEGLSVWWDPNLVPGKRFRDIIARELDAADSVVVVWTAASIQSDYVQDEAEDARERGVLVPVTLEPVKPPAGFRQVQAADLSQWTGNGQHPEFRVLLSAVHTLVEAARADAAAAGAEPGETPAATGQVPPADPRVTASPATPAQPPAAAHDHPFLPRLFDLFSLAVVWVSAAILVLAAGVQVGFGLSGAAAAAVIWAGATAQACKGLGPNRKMMVMVTSLGVALIIGASAHNPSGVVSAILVGAVIFAGFAAISLASQRGSERMRSLRAARRANYRPYASDVEHEVLERISRRRGRSRRTKPGDTPEE